MVYHIVLQHECLVQVIVIIADKAIAFFLLDITGKLCLFARIQKVIIFVYFINADKKVHRNFRDGPLDTFANGIQPFFDIATIGNHGKVIIRKATYQVITELFFETRSKSNQEIISRMKSICTIVQPHSHNIKEDNDRGTTRSSNIFYIILTTGATVFHIRKTRQRIKITVCVFT